LTLRDFISYDWFTISLGLIFISVVLLKYINTAKFNLLVKFTYSNDYFKLKDKESRYFTTFDNLIIVLAHLTAAQFVYFLIKDLEYIEIINIYPFFEVVAIFFVLLLLSFVKHQLEKFVNKCMTNSNFLSYYQFYKQIIWSYAILLGLPFLIFVIYNPAGSLSVVYFSFVIMLIFYGFKTLILIYKNRSLLIRNWYYFILYLCALEIAPYFFLYKILGVS
jgi:hypothetical protein